MAGGGGAGDGGILREPGVEFGFLGVLLAAALLTVTVTDAGERWHGAPCGTHQNRYPNVVGLPRWAAQLYFRDFPSEPRPGTLGFTIGHCGTSGCGWGYVTLTLDRQHERVVGATCEWWGSGP